MTEALLTDLYELTMLQGYFERGMRENAVFELFVRRLPAQRNFLVAAGLEQALDYLETVGFTETDIQRLRELGRFSREFLDALARFRFSGEVHAMPEGTVCFPAEPLVRVTAPLPEAQLVETRLINLVHFQTLIASKAVRLSLAAPGKQLIEFGGRRAHGAEAAVLAARAAYLAGFAGTSNVLAGIRFNIPTLGTMAHSYIEAHDVEGDAFLSYARAQPQHVALLLDTYDTEAAARRVVTLAQELAAIGIAIRSVRIDSGNLGKQAKLVRQILDEGGLGAVEIMVSGGIDERGLIDLVESGAPIDGIGIGTDLVTSADAPGLDCAYKLMEYAGRPRCKRSVGKATWPGAKQVYRRFDTAGHMRGDEIALAKERERRGVPLLEPVLQNGRRLRSDSLQAARARLAAELLTLPSPLRDLGAQASYPVERSSALVALAQMR
jgi:nicotinate phosphoribosyltransferase